MNREIAILSAVRTPIGKILGALSDIEAPELGAICIRENLSRTGIKGEDIDEVIMGNVVSAGVGQAPARRAAIKAEIPSSIPAVTINKVCGSGLKAVQLACQSIIAGDNQVVVAGGMESMSNVPFALKDLRKGRKYGNSSIVDLMIYDGLWDSFNNVHMGSLAEYTARKSGITREEQDEFAVGSHRKAISAIKSGKFKGEIVPVVIKTKREEKVVDTDEGPREDTSVEKLSKLPPAFEKEGTVTAGNAPGLNDGASTLIISSKEKADSLGVRPLAYITGWAISAIEPKELFYAPSYAIKSLIGKLGMDNINDFDLIEINEAFAAQILANGKELNVDWSKVNVHGGAIALGHPIGASGARVLTTLLYAMKDRKAKTGLCALCLGGGGAVAMSVKMED